MTIDINLMAERRKKGNLFLLLVPYFPRKIAAGKATSRFSPCAGKFFLENMRHNSCTYENILIISTARRIHGGYVRLWNRHSIYRRGFGASSCGDNHSNEKGGVLRMQMVQPVFERDMPGANKLHQMGRMRQVLSSDRPVQSSIF